MVGAVILFLLNYTIASVMVSLRTQQKIGLVLFGDARGIAANAFALGPLAWLMAQMYISGWWASLLFALPLYTTRVAYHRFVEMPKLARILHVADAFEAMTAQRPYRMTPLTPEQALGELRKFAGIQFDPAVVDAFVRTPWVHGVSDPGRREEPRQIPLIAHAANRMTQATAGGASGGGSTSATSDQA